MADFVQAVKWMAEGHKVHRKSALGIVCYVNAPTLFEQINDADIRHIMWRFYDTVPMQLEVGWALADDWEILP